MTFDGAAALLLTVLVTPGIGSTVDRTMMTTTKRNLMTWGCRRGALLLEEAGTESSKVPCFHCGRSTCWRRL